MFEVKVGGVSKIGDVHYCVETTLKKDEWAHASAAALGACQTNQTNHGARIHMEWTGAIRPAIQPPLLGAVFDVLRISRGPSRDAARLSRSPPLHRTGSMVLARFLLQVCIRTQLFFGAVAQWPPWCEVSVHSFDQQLVDQHEARARAPARYASNVFICDPFPPARCY